MIDSHTHLDACAEPDDELVAAAELAGVRRLLTIGTDPASCRRALQAAQRHPGVFAAVGRHPNEAHSFSDAELAELGAFAADERCVAIGETGLDFYRDRAPHDVQAAVFRAHIELAHAVDKPLVIHTRAADEQTLALLEAHAVGLRVVLHCFSMTEQLERCIDAGWWFSFAGNVTYPSAAELRRAAAAVPEDRLLVETDAPYLTPQTHRKRPNRPEYVVETARVVAGARGTSYERLETALEATAAGLFGW